MELLYAFIFTISILINFIKNENVDFSNKAKVKLSDILNDKRRSRSESWPPEEQNKYFKIGIKLLGDNVSANFDSNIKPTIEQSNGKKLKKLFWQNELDTQWLSVDKPQTLMGDMPLDQINAKDEMEKAANSLNFTFIDSVGAILEIPENMQTMFKKWLIEFSSCQMNYVWEDLGEMFWPRWIRRGMCTSSKSCSWPYGMGCKYSGSRTLHLLRWVCLKDENGEKAKKVQIYLLKLKAKNSKRKLYYNQKRRRRFRANNRSNRSLSVAKRKKKANRIVRQLSMAVNGQFCQWNMLKYYINDKCTCQCK